METIILITVLATLGVVALVTAIVVTFMKLSKKVDYVYLDKQLEDVYNLIDQRHEDVYRRADIVESHVDSRCDKLHQQMKNLDDKIYDVGTSTNQVNKRVVDLEKNNKQLLKG